MASYRIKTKATCEAKIVYIVEADNAAEAEKKHLAGRSRETDTEITNIDYEEIMSVEGDG